MSAIIIVSKQDKWGDFIIAINKIKKGHISMFIIGAVILLLAYILYFFTIRPYETTDNAYVQANTISIAAQISGVVSKTYVQNNQYVKMGELLFDIDPQPFVIEVQKAQAKLELAQIEAKRTAFLVAQKFVPAETNDNAITRLKSAKAALDKAELDLSYTKVYASDNGQISNYTIYPGQYISAGYPQFALISDNTFWVDANFKETQLNVLKIGQKATVNVDMYPGKNFKGVVDSISGASGTVFSLLPPQNATGNWVKVTQRVPVKIIITSVDANYPLRIGTSASVKVRTK